MNGALNRAADAGRNAARNHPPDVERSVADGGRGLWQRVAMLYASAVVAVVLFTGVVTLVAATLGGGAAAVVDTDDDQTTTTNTTPTEPTEPTDPTEPSEPTVTGLSVSPDAVSLDVGGTQQLVATADLSDGSTRDVTGVAEWTSTDAAVATVDASGLVTALGTGSTTVTATFEGVQGSTEVTVEPPPVTLTRLTIDPSPVALSAGGSEQLTATGFFSDDSTQDLTDSVVWSSADSKVATVEPGGLVTGQDGGATSVTATLDEVAETVEVTVSDVD